MHWKIITIQSVIMTKSKPVGNATMKKREEAMRGYIAKCRMGISDMLSNERKQRDINMMARFMHQKLPLLLNALEKDIADLRADLTNQFPEDSHKGYIEKTFAADSQAFGSSVSRIVHAIELAKSAYNACEIDYNKPIERMINDVKKIEATEATLDRFMDKYYDEYMKQANPDAFHLSSPYGYYSELDPKITKFMADYDKEHPVPTDPVVPEEQN